MKPRASSIVGGPARAELGQLEGRSRFRRDGGSRMDGTPDRALATWVVRGEAGDEVAITARHQRAGTARATITLAGKLPGPPSG